MEWDGYNGQDILNMIEELKPDVLSRFSTGMPRLNADIDMGPGAPPMKFADYLTAAMKAGAPGCIMTSKVHLDNIWRDEYRMNSSRALRDMPVTPQLTELDLDNYFTNASEEKQNSFFAELRSMGWQRLVFNFAGREHKEKKLEFADYGLVPISPRRNWEIGKSILEKVKSRGVRPLTHIDYPLAMGEFKKLTPN